MQSKLVFILTPNHNSMAFSARSKQDLGGGRSLLDKPRIIDAERLRSIDAQLKQLFLGAEQPEVMSVAQNGTHCAIVDSVTYLDASGGNTTILIPDANSPQQSQSNVEFGQGLLKLFVMTTSPGAFSCIVQPDTPGVAMSTTFTGIGQTALYMWSSVAGGGWRLISATAGAAAANTLARVLVAGNETFDGLNPAGNSINGTAYSLALDTAFAPAGITSTVVAAAAPSNLQLISQASTNNSGGTVRIIGGASTNASGGGALVTGGASTSAAAGQNGGAVVITSGANNGAASSTGTASLASANSALGASGDVAMRSGVSAAGSGDVVVESGNDTGAGTSGTLILRTGASATALSGDFLATTGNGTTSGNLTFSSSGTIQVGGATGQITITSGNVNPGGGALAINTTGGLTLQTGGLGLAATANTTGSILLSTGGVVAGAGVATTGTVTIESGTVNAGGTGSTGAVALRSGSSQNAGATAGSVTVAVGSSALKPALLSLTGGLSSTGAAGGDVTMTAGASTTGAGGAATLAGGAAPTNGLGGAVAVTGGSTQTGGAGGSINVTGGALANNVAGRAGDVTMRGGTAGTGSGGRAFVFGGEAAGVAAVGGDVVFAAGGNPLAGPATVGSVGISGSTDAAHPCHFVADQTGFPPTNTTATSSDMAGRVQLGAGASAVAVTFGVPYRTSAPIVVVSALGAIAAPIFVTAITTAGFTVNNPAGNGAVDANYIVIGTRF